MSIALVPSYGMNLGSYNYYNTSHPFTDLARQGGWGLNGSGFISRDIYGNIESLTGTARKWLCLHNGQQYPTGIYRIEWEGSGDVYLAPVGGKPLIHQYVTGGQSGSIKYKTYLVTATNDLALQFQTNGSGINTVKNFKALAPFENTNITDTFRYGYTGDIANVGVLRFMDLNNTNNSTISTWSQRITPNHQSWGTSGIPYEAQIDLCNQTNKDMWLCVPHRADDDYVTNLANLVSTGLKSNLKVWVEYSNECWNWGFTQATYCNDVLRPQFGVANYYRAYGVRAAQVIYNFKQRITGDRVVGVIAQQAANSYSLSEALLASRINNVQQADVAAIAPYFYLDNINGLYNDWVNGTVNLNQVFTDLSGSINNSMDNWTSSCYGVAYSHSIPLVSYEGGQHIVASSGNTNTEFTKFINTGIQRTTQMSGLYNYMLSKFRNNGGLTFTNFTYIETGGRYGFWGVQEGYKDNQAPKYLALKNFYNSVPSTMANPFSSSGGVNLLTGLISYYPGDEVGGRLIDKHSNNTLVDFLGPNAPYPINIFSQSGARKYRWNAGHGHSGSLNYSPTGSFTIACWTTTTPASVGQRTLMSQYYTGITPAWSIARQNSTTGAYLFGMRGTSGLRVINSTDSVYNQKKLVICSYDSINNLMSIKLDNGIANSATFTGGVPFSWSGAFTVGHFLPNSERYEGLIGKTAIWDRKLTLDEENLLWNNGQGINYPFGNFIDYTKNHSGYAEATLSNPASTLNGFLYYVSLNQLPTSFWTNVGPSGRDIRVTKRDGTILPRDIISFTNNGTSGSGVIAVLWEGDKKPDEVDKIRIWVGDQSAVEPGSGTAYGSLNAYPWHNIGSWIDGANDRTIYQNHFSYVGNISPSVENGPINGSKSISTFGTGGFGTTSTKLPYYEAGYPYAFLVNAKSKNNTINQSLFGIHRQGQANGGVLINYAGHITGNPVRLLTRASTSGSSLITGYITGEWADSAAVLTDTNLRQVYYKGTGGLSNTTNLAYNQQFTSIVIGASRDQPSSVERFSGNIAFPEFYLSGLSPEWIKYRSDMLSVPDQSNFFINWQWKGRNAPTILTSSNLYVPNEQRNIITLNSTVPVTWSIPSGVDANKVGISGNNLYFLTAPNINNPDDSDLDNIYKFNLFASGASGTDELPISVQVVEFISNTPVNTTPPTINGIAYIDNTLSINTGIWQNTDSFEYSWYYNSNPDTNGTILPESSNSLYLINDYSGYYIYGSVNGINSTGSAQVFTNIVGPVILYIPTGGGGNSGVNPSGYNAMTMFGVQDIRYMVFDYQTTPTRFKRFTLYDGEN